jgi:hypothetical protein
LLCRYRAFGRSSYANFLSKPLVGAWLLGDTAPRRSCKIVKRCFDHRSSLEIVRRLLQLFLGNWQRKAMP